MGEIKRQGRSYEPSFDDDFKAWLTSSGRRAALVIAHPAHEMRILNWVCQVRPRVYILTSGSRSQRDHSRYRASAKLIAECGGVLAGDWGAILDRDLYDFLLEAAAEPFHNWCDSLTRAFIEAEIDVVLADAWQNYNVAHDLTHVMARLAVTAASAQTGRHIEFLEFPVVPDSLCAAAPRAPEATFTLDESAIERKRAAVASYPDIAREAADIESAEGEGMLTREVVRAAPPWRHLAEPVSPPLYERFGEERVSAGTYGEVIRWRHVAHICDALRERAAQSPSVRRNAPG